MKRIAYIFTLFLLWGTANLYAQNPIDKIPGVRGMRSGTGTGQDSLKRRDSNEDSITIRFRYLDTSRLMMLDSSVTDFRVRFPLPMDYTFLGNLGQAARPYGFSPRMVSGWDPGFHAFDIYKLRLDRIKFFQTTRPFSQLGYLLGRKQQQV